VLFFDEFETLGKERGDRHETGEIKRVVSSLLMNIDALPSYVVVIAATNHEALLDIAAWRRFQVKIELGKPSVDDIQCWLSSFEKRMRFSFNIQLGNLAKRLLGKSYAEVEEFALSIYRQYILKGFATDTRTLTEFRLNQDSSLSMHKNSSM
jgi:AAA+ superfamily predicted ATPase